jgi:hypothetical protein
LTVVFTVRAVFGAVRQEWVVIGAALVLGYLAFMGIAFSYGLDADDKLIARAVWARMRGTFRARR